MNKFQVSSKSASVTNGTVVVVQVKDCNPAFIPVQTNYTNLITRFMRKITEEKA